MTIPFYKYQGAGNDFVLLDNRSGDFSHLPKKIVAFLCDRHFGIGADGLMLLGTPAGSEDFSMRYYNSDGRESTMCGNGGRCITAFAARLLGAKKTYTFTAIDGLHTAEIVAENDSRYTVRLQMVDVKNIEQRGNDYFLNTGSPHLVRFVDDAGKINIIPEAHALRYGEPLASQGGANINFVQRMPDGSLRIRTYERGVEDETLACGTGATAAAIAARYAQGVLSNNEKISCTLQARGGNLTVDFQYTGNTFVNIFLTGPATFVFEGTLNFES